MRLGILRSSLVRANLGAMALAAWFGFQFVATLYMQQLRGWSALETGLAIFPAGLLVAVMSPRVAPLIERFGVTRLIVAGLASIAAAYVLFVPIGLDSSYGAACCRPSSSPDWASGSRSAPLNVAATSGVAPEEQGLAGGLLNTSFQLGGAFVLAVVTAVANASTGADGSASAVLDGFHAALYVTIAAALLGALAMLHRRPARAAAEAPLEEAFEEAA